MAAIEVGAANQTRATEPTPEPAGRVLQSGFGSDQSVGSIVEAVASNAIVAEVRVVGVTGPETYLVPGTSDTFAASFVDAVVIDAYQGEVQRGERISLVVVNNELIGEPLLVGHGLSLP